MGYTTGDQFIINFSFATISESLAHLALYPMTTTIVSCKRSGQGMKLTTLFNPEQILNALRYTSTPQCLDGEVVN
jgi:hypothetical protein